MERYLLICFQAGHIASAVGRTLLTIHEVVTHGSFDGRTAFPTWGQNPQASEETGAKGPARERTEVGKQRKNRVDEAEARGQSGRPQSGDSETAEIEKSNGSSLGSVLDLDSFITELDVQNDEKANA